METLGQRLARYRNEAQYTQKSLAAACDWQNGQGRIANYEKDKREPSLADLRTLSEALNKPLMHIIEGEDGSAVGVSPRIDEYALIPQYTAHGSAGSGHLNDHIEVKGGLVFRRDWLQRMALKERNLHVIYAKGHSMEPTICDEDVVLIDDVQITPRDRRIYAMLKPDGELIIKRLVQSLTGGWIIRSDNEDKRQYPDQPATDSEIGHLRIIGRIVWHGGAL
ncbi:XRE family transcriptional regulator [Pseudomonas marginalis]|uniref:XRE family transcriptional regulator n=1 Tax=Pseudomonas marginalis TaxID=298 RepID=UPI0012864AD0|nr:LexA family transcriptional regulator [Pseudomonas marginalis]KAA8552354.1 putative HTH-type transcriptional regulator [Pseudomonas marginalis]